MTVTLSLSKITITHLSEDEGASPTPPSRLAQGPVRTATEIWDLLRTAIRHTRKHEKNGQTHSRRTLWKIVLALLWLQKTAKTKPKT
jgi:hypothetical protein